MPVNGCENVRSVQILTQKLQRIYVKIYCSFLLCVKLVKYNYINS